ETAGCANVRAQSERRATSDERRATSVERRASSVERRASSVELALRYSGCGGRSSCAGLGQGNAAGHYGPILGRRVVLAMGRKKNFLRFFRKTNDRNFSVPLLGVRPGHHPAL